MTLIIIAIVLTISIALASQALSDEDTPWGVRPAENQTPWSANSFDFASSGDRRQDHSSIERRPKGHNPVLHGRIGPRTGSALPRGSVARFDKDGQGEPMYTSSVEKNVHTVVLMRCILWDTMHCTKLH